MTKQFKGISMNRIQKVIFASLIGLCVQER